MLAIDWGTTSFRAYRLDPAGRIVDSRLAPAGILGQPVHLLCTPQLADVYVQALDALGLESSTLDSNAVTHVRFRLASHLKK